MLFYSPTSKKHGVGDSSVGIATRYGLDGPGIESRLGVEIFRTRTDRPWGPSSLLYNGYRVFPGVKRPGRGADQPPASKRRGHERVGLYLYSPSGPSWPGIRRTLPFLQTKNSQVLHVLLYFDYVANTKTNLGFREMFLSGKGLHRRKCLNCTGLQTCG